MPCPGSGQFALHPAGGSICTVAHTIQRLLPKAGARATGGVCTGGLGAIKHLVAHRKGAKSPNQELLDK